MQTRPKKLLSFSLLVAGTVIVICGLTQLFRANQFSSIIRVRVNEDANELLNWVEKHPEKKPDDMEKYLLQSWLDDLQDPKSDSVLSNAIVRLKRHEAPTKSFPDDVSRTTEARIRFIRDHMDVIHVRGTLLIEVSFTAPDADESAAVVIAIAQAYVDYRKKSHPRSNAEAMEILRARYVEEEKQLQILSTNSTSSLAKYHELLGPEINLWEFNVGHPVRKQYEAPITAVTKIVDVRTVRTGPNRRLGAGLLIGGLLAMAAGVCLARREPEYDLEVALKKAGIG